MMMKWTNRMVIALLVAFLWPVTHFNWYVEGNLFFIVESVLVVVLAIGVFLYDYVKLRNQKKDESCCRA